MHPRSVVTSVALALATVLAGILVPVRKVAAAQEIPCKSCSLPQADISTM